MVKPLNALLLGDRYAANMGISVYNTHRYILMVTGILVSVCTAFCGPISFIGMAVPHLSRMLFRTSDHRILMPSTIMIGAILTLFCSLVSTLPGERGIIPINVITPILGAPIILYVIIRKR
jgi:iron complex transport system permease protein